MTTWRLIAALPFLLAFSGSCAAQNQPWRRVGAGLSLSAVAGPALALQGLNGGQTAKHENAAPQAKRKVVIDEDCAGPAARPCKRRSR